MKWCIGCGDAVPEQRAELGFRTCLSCGEAAAQKEAERRKGQVAPLFNKGAYQYITSESQLHDIGRK